MKFISEATVFLPHGLLLLAVCGAAMSWIRPLGVPLPGWLATLAIFAAVFAILIFGTWSEFASRADLHYMGIGGRIPHSDAANYFLGAFEIGYAGRWGDVPSYRPLAAAFRSLIVGAAGLSYSWAVILQAALLAAALSFAARSVTRWLGPWSALAFAAFTLILIRPFLATAMTEPLALIFALCGVAFLADALRMKCFHSALMVLLCVSAAQATRLGAVFLIPATAAWVFLAHFDRPTWMRRLVLVAIAALAPHILAEVLRALYAHPNVSSDGNLAYILCGLARGTGWGECRDHLIAQGIPRNIGVFMPALYDLAWRSFKADPTLASAALWNNLSGYVTGAPWFMLAGYTSTFSAPRWLVSAMLGLCAVGAAIQFHRSPRDILFWLFAVCGIAISAAVVFGTDGWRTLYAIHPLVALFLAMGWRSGRPDEGPAADWRPALIAAPLCAAALILAPAILHLALRHPPSTEFDARAVTGFVIIPDGSARLSVPSMHAGEFERMVATTKLELEFGPFVQPIIAAAPIAMFWTVQIGQRGHAIYFGPPDVLTSKTARAWRFTFRDPPPWQNKGTPMLLIENASEHNAR